MTTKRTATAVFLAAAGMLSLAACGSDDSGSGSSASGSVRRSREARLRDPARRRLVQPLGERRPPRPRDGVQGVGFETDIQNAQGDTNKYATIADQQLTKGCGVMLLVDLNGAGAR